MPIALEDGEYGGLGRLVGHVGWNARQAKTSGSAGYTTEVTPHADLLPLDWRLCGLSNLVEHPFGILVVV